MNVEEELKKSRKNLSNFIKKLKSKPFMKSITEIINADFKLVLTNTLCYGFDSSKKNVLYIDIYISKGSYYDRKLLALTKYINYDGTDIDLLLDEISNEFEKLIYKIIKQIEEENSDIDCYISDINHNFDIYEVGRDIIEYKINYYHNHNDE